MVVPTEANDNYERGKKLAREEKYTEAKLLLSKLVPADRYYMDAQFYMGFCFLLDEKDDHGTRLDEEDLLKNYQKAINIFEKVLNAMEQLKDVKKIDVLRRLGDSNRRIRNFETAFEFYKDALDISDNNFDFIAIKISIGAGYFNLKQYDEAIKYWRQALAIDKDDSDAWNNLAHVLSIVNRTDDGKHAIDIALEKKDKMPELKQKNVASYYHTKGVIEFQLGDQKESICSFKKALSINPEHFEARMNLASIYIQTGYLQSALKEICEAEKLKPNSGQVHYNKAICMSGMGKYETVEDELRKSQEYFNKIVNKHKNRINSPEPCDLDIIAETYNYLGLIEGMYGNHSNAIRYFSDIIEFYTDTNNKNKVSPDIHLVHAYRNMGVACVKMNNEKSIKFFETAMDILNEASSKQERKGHGNVTTKVYTLNGLGVAHINKWKKDRRDEDMDKGKEYFNKAVSLFGDKAYGPNHSLAQIDDFYENHEKAIITYDKAINNGWYNGFVEGYIGKARACVELKMHEDAASCLTEAISIYNLDETYKDDLTLAEAYRNLGFIELVAKISGDEMSAKKYFLEAVKEGDAFALTSKGQTLINLGKYEKANHYLSKALEKNDQDTILSRRSNENKEFIEPLALANKGLALSFLGNFDEANECFAKAMEKEKYILRMHSYDYHILNYKGLSYYIQKRYDDAIRYFREAQEAKKKTFAMSKKKRKQFNYALANEGYAHIGNENYGDALVCFEKVIHNLCESKESALCKPEDLLERFVYAYALNGKGQSHMELDDYEDAMYCFVRSFEVDPSVKNQSYLNIGICKYKQEDYVNALEYFKKVEDVSPENLTSFFDRKSVTASQKHNNIGLCYYNLGLLEEAKEEFRLALKLNPRMDDSYYNLGVVYNGEKNPERAKTLFKTCLKVNRRHDDANKALNRMEDSGYATDWYQWWFKDTRYKKILGELLISFISLLVLTTIYFSIFSTGISFPNPIGNMTLSNFLPSVNFVVPTSQAQAQGIDGSNDNGTKESTPKGNLLTTNQSEEVSTSLSNQKIPFQPNVIVLSFIVLLLLLVLLFPSLKSVKIANIELTTSPIDIPVMEFRPTQSITASSNHMPLHFHSPSIGLSLTYIHS